MKTVLPLEQMTAAQRSAWELCLDLANEFSEWAVVGGQMVWLHTIVAGSDPLRSTEDLDVVVDLRAAPHGLRFVNRWLTGRDLRLQPPNAFGQSHRYIRHGVDGDPRLTEWCNTRSAAHPQRLQARLKQPAYRVGMRSRFSSMCPRAWPGWNADGAVGHGPIGNVTLGSIGQELRE